MLLLVLGHVNDDEIAVTAVEDVAQSQHGFRLAHARRSDHEKDADRAPGIDEVGAGRADALGDGFQRVRLADDALFELLAQRQDGFDLIEDHLADGDARPAGDDGGHGLTVDDRMEKRRLAL